MCQPDKQEKLARVPGNIILKKGTANLPKASFVVVSQIATVDKSRLLEKIGTLEKDEIEETLKNCQIVISQKL